MPAVIRTLITARDKRKNTPNPADRAVTDAQFAHLDDTNPNSLLSLLIKEATDVDIALAAQAPLTSALNQQGARLTMYVSHFHQVGDFAILRGDLPLGSRGYWGRDIHATTIPDLSTYNALEIAAKAVVNGEARRFADEGAAHTPMSNPSAGQIAGILSGFLNLRRSSEIALEKTDDEREEAQALYPAAQALAVDICETVEFFFRSDKVSSSFREKCRRWGVVYIYEPTEPRDAGDTTGPGTGGVAPVVPAPTPAP